MGPPRLLEQEKRMSNVNGYLLARFTRAEEALHCPAELVPLPLRRHVGDYHASCAARQKASGGREGVGMVRRVRADR